MTHSFRYPAPITALGMSPDSRTLAVGMANGTLSVKQLKAAPSAKTIARGKLERPLPPHLHGGTREHAVLRTAAPNFRHLDETISSGGREVATF